MYESRQGPRQGAADRSDARYLSLLLEYGPGGMAVLDRDMHYLVANRGWLEAFGLDKSDLVGRPCAEFFDGLDGRWDAVRACCLSGAIERCKSDYVTTRSGQRRKIRWEIRPWGQDVARPDGLILLFEDNGLPDSRDEAEEGGGSSGMMLALGEGGPAGRSKSEFLANMSHELRSPLNAIIGFAEIIRNEMFGPIGQDQYREYIADIYSSASHLLTLINDILDLSKIEAGKQDLAESEIVFHEALRACQRIIHARAEEGDLTVTSEFAADLPLLYADERMLKQILINLLSNAVKFTPPGGEIRTTAYVDQDGWFVARISDTGIGIAADELDKAMSVFGQVDSDLDRRANGTGLGLPLSKSLVTLHGGTFALDSEPGTGTTITLRFPPDRVVEVPANLAKA